MQMNLQIGGVMTKMNQKNEETLASKSRRDFFKKTSVLSIAAAGTLAPVVVSADDNAIMHHPKWGQSWGDPATKNLYGIPSHMRYF